MNQQIGFIVKLLLISAGVSVGIKFFAPYLDIAPTISNALVAIAIPPLVMSAVLFWRSRRS